MIENFFVIFPPAAGGNHLANIVSTSPRFTTRFSQEVYEDSNRHKAHPIGGGRNFYYDEDSLRAIQGSSNVFCSHFAEYLVSKNLAEKFLPNRKFLMVEFPEHTRNEFFLERSKKHYPAYQDGYFIEELSMMYSIDAFQAITKETDLSKVTVDMIFTSDVAPLMSHLNSEFGLDLNLETVDYIHRKWLEKNGQS